MIEVFDGPTPAGGVRAVIYYGGDYRNSVDKSKAKEVIISEFDKDWELIRETFWTVKSKEEE